MRFIDLFAGVGGFHKALHELGHECVFASEINLLLRELYEKNWEIKPEGDIKKIVEQDITLIPEHDVLTAGFPCQPFSKAGKQEGREDLERGTLFDEIVKILKFRKPSFFILENVPFIAKHDNEATWGYIKRELSSLGYEVNHRNYSPHEFGIPQHRLRIFIVGARRDIGLKHFHFEEVDKNKISLIPIETFLEENSTSKKLPERNIECLDIWQQLIDRIPKDKGMPGFPLLGDGIWSNLPL